MTTATKRKLSNPLALAVLALLAERPMHPYEMDLLMRQRGLTESIKLNRGSLYTVVEVLQRDGLIVSQEIQREGKRPERTIYALTEAGGAKFNGWLRHLLRKPVHEYREFVAGLTFLGHISPEETVALLEERFRALEQEADDVRFKLGAATAQLGVPRLFLIEGEFVLSQWEAELQWIRAVVQDIKDGTLTWPTEESLQVLVKTIADLAPAPLDTAPPRDVHEKGDRSVG